MNSHTYDVIIIGGGHAGCEAALSCARLEKKTILFSINLDAIANLPCNPSIGGTAKGHLVREIDALGGEMGKAADKVFIQSRMLNKSRGPAVHSLRIQADRRAYQEIMKGTLEKQQNLDIKQSEIVEVTKNSEDMWGVTTRTGEKYLCRALILATGTYLDGRIVIGETSYSGGPDGLFAATSLSQSLETLGIPLRRFKTGTPPRINRNSIDFSHLAVQAGDDDIIPFSFENEDRDDFKNQVVCHICYTNERTHDVIRENLHRSPLFSGDIKGVGPRYCPSIEDKVVRFPDKDRHQLFIEPMGLNTDEMYLQGLSSSLPEDVQALIVHSIEGLENAVIMRSAYAIEYDCIDSLGLKASLEFKDFDGLFSAGQISGSSGYEEAAAQGLIAGINAVRYLDSAEPVLLTRDNSYIGVLIDDMITKGVKDPYRMLTARAEFRLILRQDNADARLTPLGHEIGLISEERFQQFTDKQNRIEAEVKRLRNLYFSPNELNPLLEEIGTTAVQSGISAAEILKRPEVTLTALYSLPSLATNNLKTHAEISAVEIIIKYEGYISRQQEQLAKMKKLEDSVIPDDFDYSALTGLRIEAKEKLIKARPRTIGQASRISGVNPADITYLLININRR